MEREGLGEDTERISRFPYERKYDRYSYCYYNGRKRFQKVIESLVKDVISPVIGLFIAQPDFSNLLIGPVKIGSFIITLISFLLTRISYLPFCSENQKKLEEFREKGPGNRS